MPTVCDDPADQTAPFRSAGLSRVLERTRKGIAPRIPGCARNLLGPRDPLVNHLVGLFRIRYSWEDAPTMQLIREELLTVTEAAQHSGVSPSSVNNWITAGSFRAMAPLEP